MPNSGKLTIALWAVAAFISIITSEMLTAQAISPPYDTLWKDIVTLTLSVATSLMLMAGWWRETKALVRLTKAPPAAAAVRRIKKRNGR